MDFKDNATKIFLSHESAPQWIKDTYGMKGDIDNVVVFRMQLHAFFTYFEDTSTNYADIMCILNEFPKWSVYKEACMKEGRLCRTDGNPWDYLFSHIPRNRYEQVQNLWRLYCILNEK